MINVKLLTSLLILFVVTPSCGQTKKEFTWPNGAKAAIALTYDDGLSSHINTVVPMLKKYGFKATFYPTASSPSLYNEMDKWKDLAREGHELGNHTIYHPCQKSKTGMDWVKEYHDLDTYSLDQITEEIQVANTMLFAIDGNKARTFAYPCAHYFAGGESYKELVSSKFLSARGSSQNQDELVKLSMLDLNNVFSWSPNGHNASELISYINKVMELETFSAITFHGVGAEHMIVSEETHEEMLQFLDANRDKVWVATFQEITTYIESNKRSEKK